MKNFPTINGDTYNTDDVTPLMQDEDDQANYERYPRGSQTIGSSDNTTANHDIVVTSAHIYNTSTKWAVISLLVMTLINLLNYMDRFTSAGRLNTQL